MGIDTGGGHFDPASEYLQSIAEGYGCALALDKLISTGPGSGLRFLPLIPSEEASSLFIA